MTRPAFGAICAIGAGALLIVVPLLVEFVSGDLFALMALVALLFALSLPGLHRLHAGADGSAGRRGLRLLMVGMIALAVLIASADAIDAAVSGSTQELVETVFMVLAGLASVAALVGVVMLGTGMLRARVLPRTWIAVFLVGMVFAFVSENFEQSLDGAVPTLADVLPPSGFMLAGVGLLMLGRAAWVIAATGKSPAAGSVQNEG